MRELHWQSELDFGDGPVAITPLDEARLRGFEQLLNITLPDDYRQMLMSHHGDAPLESEYRLSTPEGEMFGGIGIFLSPDPYAEGGILAVASRFARGVVPIAEDGGGNFLCFDFRDVSNGSEVKVVYWDHELNEEDTYFFVASSFSELLNALFVPEDVLEDLDEQGVLPDDLRR
jgi:cell wall assembly regulator SMI1